MFGCCSFYSNFLKSKLHLLRAIFFRKRIVPLKRNHFIHETKRMSLLKLSSTYPRFHLFEEITKDFFKANSQNGPKWFDISKVPISMFYLSRINGSISMNKLSRQSKPLLVVLYFIRNLQCLLQCHSSVLHKSAGSNPHPLPPLPTLKQKIMKTH